MRRFETDYAGAWRGFCSTRESAVVAATRRIMNDGYTRATITDRVTGETVARLALDGDKRSVEIVTKNIIKKERK